MNWEAISAIGQIVGALAVVISLIYLAREIRSNARSARVASERSLVQMLIQFTQQLAEHPHLSELFYRGIHDFESLEGAERMRFSALIVQLFRLYEETYYGQSEGHVAARIWRQAEAPLRDFSGYPGVQAWWRSRSHWFGEDFANLVNQLQRTAKPPRLYGEPMTDE